MKTFVRNNLSALVFLMPVAALATQHVDGLSGAAPWPGQAAQAQSFYVEGGSAFPVPASEKAGFGGGKSTAEFVDWRQVAPAASDVSEPSSLDLIFGAKTDVPASIVRSVEFSGIDQPVAVRQQSSAMRPLKREARAVKVRSEGGSPVTGFGEQELSGVSSDQVGDVCGRIGPFPTRSVASAISERVEHSGADSYVKVDDALVAREQRVVVSPLENLGLAQALLEYLKTNGIDYGQVIPGGEFRNGISLGLFKNAGNVKLLTARLAELGLDYRVLADVKERSQFYVPYRTPAGKPEPAEALDWSERFSCKAFEFFRPR